MKRLRLLESILWFCGLILVFTLVIFVLVQKFKEEQIINQNCYQIEDIFV